MRGIPEYNFPAFYAAAASLRARGIEVWSPAEHDVHADGFNPVTDTHQPMRHYMKRDLPAVLDADFVAVLPGWENSQGAKLEVAVARACDIPVLHAADLSPVSANPPVEKSGPCSICGFSDWPKDCPGRKNDDGTACAYVGQLQRELAEMSAINHRLAANQIGLRSATPASDVERMKSAIRELCYQQGEAPGFQHIYYCRWCHYASGHAHHQDCIMEIATADNTSKRDGEGA
jgi:hypothetical protein